MSLDTDNAACKRFYAAVRKFCRTAKNYTPGSIRVDTTPHERLDITKLSQRMYGTRDEVLAVMAACGLDTAYQPLEQQTVVLPTPAMLLQLKRAAGFESTTDLRLDGSPLWSRY